MVVYCRLWGVLLVIGCCLVSACQSVSGPTLGELESRDVERAGLEPIALPVVESSVAADAESLYNAALAVTDDTADQEDIRRGLAALAMRKGERADADGRTSTAYYRQAIERYQGLLDDYPAAPDRDFLLYQLSKASELSGDLELTSATLKRLIRQYPASPFVTEAHFRVGEMYYTERRYPEASRSYTQVIGVGSVTPLYLNALYMRGWAEFKQSEHLDALASFALVLDDLVPPSGVLDDVGENRRAMLDDTLRVTSLSHAYEGGVDTLDQVFGARDAHYLPILYTSLAEHYVEKERFRDAAETYDHYIERYPDTLYAPDFSMRVVDIYREGGFPSLVAPAMQRHVESYGVRTAYWAQADDAQREKLRPQLSEYLDELATYEHAQAQQTQEKADGVVGTRTREHYLAAISWYQEFVETAPNDPRVEEAIFLTGESYYEIADFSGAVDAFEQVAYPAPAAELDAGADPGVSAESGEAAALAAAPADTSAPAEAQGRGAEAGYLAIVSYEEQMAKVAEGPPGVARDTELAQWRQRKVDSALRFVETYPEDPRSLAALGRISEELLAEKDYEWALSIAAVITDYPQPVPRELSATAWLVTAQAQFEQKQYTEAEQAFSTALNFIDNDDPQRVSVVDRLGASAYQSGQVALQAGDSAAAAESFMRVAAIAPAAAVAEQAQNDAAALFVQTEQLERAESVLLKLQREETDPVKLNELREKLAEVYVKQEKWGLAAAEYERLAEGAENPVTRREAMYLSAELYQKSGANGAAIQAYKRYIDNYPEQFDDVTEARHQLAELYAKGGREKDRRYWLQQLIDGHEDAGRAATERSGYLAAGAVVVFADDAYQAYNATRLSLPLATSLKRKQKALNKTVDAYNEVAGYKVAEYSSLARYRTADINATMAAAILASPRPPGLDPDSLDSYEIVLEDLAYPYEEDAIKLHETNTQLARGAGHNEWVERSYEALATLLPFRYNKQENTVKFSDRMY